MPLKEQLAAAHFAKIANVYGDSYASPSPIGYLFRTRLERVYELVGEVCGMRVLDVGCGAGIVAPYFAKRDCKYFGIDLVAEMVLECRRRFGQSGLVQVGVGSIQSLPFLTASFELVLCLGVVEYVEDLRRALGEVSRVTKQNGNVVLSMQNRLSPYRLWDRHIYHSRLFNLLRKMAGRPGASELLETPHALSSLRSVLSDSQLQICDVVFYDFNLWLPPLDRYFPRLSVSSSRKLESLRQSMLKGLGTGYIVKARKVSASGQAI
jgi:ubiquinone/menaquinone biosynthesis C-methylase UbiE